MLAFNPPRFVHAKMYRLWAKGIGEILITGSVNLTNAAHSHARAGNLEAAWFIDTSEKSCQRWWLQARDEDPSEFANESATEESEITERGLDLSLRFHWGENRLEYRFRENADTEISLSALSGSALGILEATPHETRWHTAPTALADAVHEHLRGSSLIRATTAGHAWTILVREENLAHKPSLLSKLTPEEILEYWSLLTPEQRASFLETHVEAQLEGLQHTSNRLTAEGSLFDRFAGIFHAFGCLRRFIFEALEEDRPAEAESRLFGAKYDSLPNLLTKELEPWDEDRDPVARYVTFLCAQQLRDEIEADQPEFVASCGTRTRQLDTLLSRIPDAREALSLADKRSAEFLSWYESAFLDRAES